MNSQQDATLSANATNRDNTAFDEIKINALQVGDKVHYEKLLALLVRLNKHFKFGESKASNMKSNAGGAGQHNNSHVNLMKPSAALKKKGNNEAQTAAAATADDDDYSNFNLNVNTNVNAGMNIANWILLAVFLCIYCVTMLYFCKSSVILCMRLYSDQLTSSKHCSFIQLFHYYFSQAPLPPLVWTVRTLTTPVPPRTTTRCSRRGQRMRRKRRRTFRWAR